MRTPFACDGPIPNKKADFSASRKAEKQFAVSLRKIAKHIDDFVRATYADTALWQYQFRNWAERYAETLDAWAHAVVRKMHAQVSIRDWRQWERLSKEMGAELRREIMNAPTGEALRQLMSEQVTLIKSIPPDAAQRVHEYVIKGISEGRRHEALVEQVMRIGDVTKARATLIARTETSRTASILTQVRAEAAGSEAYIWETALDERVRPSHRAMQGKLIRWDGPPTTDGLVGHAGQLPNCRCYCRPIWSSHNE